MTTDDNKPNKPLVLYAIADDLNNVFGIQLYRYQSEEFKERIQGYNIRVVKLQEVLYDVEDVEVLK